MLSWTVSSCNDTIVSVCNKVREISPFFFFLVNYTCYINTSFEREFFALSTDTKNDFFEKIWKNRLREIFVSVTVPLN